MSGATRRARTLRARRAAIVALGGVALVLIAFIFDASPLFVPGIALAAIGAAAPAWAVASGRGARISRRLTADQVIEGEPLRTMLELRRPFGLGGWGGLEAVDPATGQRLRLGGPGSPMGRSRVARVHLPVRFAHRGEQRLDPPRLIAADPLQLAEFRPRGDGRIQTVLVLPRTEPVRWLGSPRGTRLSGSAGEGAVAQELAATDLEGLRPYRPGTPASRIHWPAVARGRGLIERRLQAEGDRRPLVVLDARPSPTYGADREGGLDAAVRAAASLVLELARGGGCGLLLAGQRRPTFVDGELGAWPAVRARLAIVGTAADLEPIRAPSLAVTGARLGAVIYVAAAAHARLAVGLAGAARGSVTLVLPDTELVDGGLPGAGGRGRPVLAVSGCQGFRLRARTPVAGGPVRLG